MLRIALSSLHGPDLRRCECGDRWVHTRQRRNQAGAVISGAAAVVLRQHPTRTNNKVKALLTEPRPRSARRPTPPRARDPYLVHETRQAGGLT